jgi:phosphoserine phosphatase
MKIGIFLDVDGVCTLEPANLQYARLLGVEKEQLEMEEAFSSKEMSTGKFGEKQVELFSSKSFTREWAERNFANILLKIYSEDLLQFPDVFLVSSSPNYFIEPLAKKYSIPPTNLLCSQYEFDANGMITKCANPVNSLMKKNFVIKHKGNYDITIGISDLPKQDDAFLHQCNFSIIIGKFVKGHLSVQDIEPINDFLENLRNICVRSDFEEVNQRNFTEIVRRAKDFCDNSQYDKNVFIMTPYSDDYRYEKVIEITRNTLKNNGYNSWLASDKKLEPTLWANVQAFMLACKYGIAIFTCGEESKGNTVQNETSHFNPNVSIELGFMLSRGKEVLLLKDKALKKMPTDMMGSLYQDFDLNAPEQSLVRILENWCNEILGNEEHSDST